MNQKESQASTPSDDEPRNDAAKTRAVDDENRDQANRTMPGRRAALPAGTLRRTPQEPQGDENRDQPVAPDGSLTVPSKPPQT